MAADKVTVGNKTQTTAGSHSVSFARPPVIETVIGVQFRRLPALTAARLGAFWKELGDEWVELDLVPEADEQYETFGAPAAWGGIRLQLSQRPVSRLRMRNVAGDRMIQVQNGRLDYNWLGKPGREYPRYSNVKPEFEAILASLEASLNARQLGPLEPNQWEVTYVNHILRDTVWSSAKESCEVFPGLLGAPPVLEPVTLEGFGSHWHFEIAPQRGRLHVEIRHGRLGGPTGDEAVIMKLTARGPVTDAMPLTKGLDLGHDVIVTAFRDLTSPSAHAYWGIRP